MVLLIINSKTFNVDECKNKISILNQQLLSNHKIIKSLNNTIKQNKLNIQQIENNIEELKYINIFRNTLNEYQLTISEEKQKLLKLNKEYNIISKTKNNT